MVAPGCRYVNHAELARQNERLCATCEHSTEWRATTAFYAALHAVCHTTAPQGRSGLKRHRDRRDELRRSHPKLVGPYAALYNLSVLARYHPEDHPLDAAEVERAVVVAKLILIDCCVP